MKHTHSGLSLVYDDDTRESWTSVKWINHDGFIMPGMDDAMKKAIKNHTFETRYIVVEFEGQLVKGGEVILNATENGKVHKLKLIGYHL